MAVRDVRPRHPGRALAGRDAGQLRHAADHAGLRQGSWVTDDGGPRVPRPPRWDRGQRAGPRAPGDRGGGQRAGPHPRPHVQPRDHPARPAACASGWPQIADARAAVRGCSCATPAPRPTRRRSSSPASRAAPGWWPPPTASTAARWGPWRSPASPRRLTPSARFPGRSTFVPYGDVEALRAPWTSRPRRRHPRAHPGGGRRRGPARRLPRGRAQDRRRRAGALLILDEVQTGIGRTGHWSWPTRRPSITGSDPTSSPWPRAWAVGCRSAR